MNRNYNHTLHTNRWHREEELQNTNRHKTLGGQLKWNNQLPLPHQEESKTKKDT